MPSSLPSGFDALDKRRLPTNLIARAHVSYRWHFKSTLSPPSVGVLNEPRSTRCHDGKYELPPHKPQSPFVGLCRSRVHEKIESAKIAAPCLHLEAQFDPRPQVVGAFYTLQQLVKRISDRN